jgi:hypothetical protein
MRRQARLAQDFAAALEGRGVGSARRDPALAPLLRLAQGLQAVPVAPAPDFRDALRGRLLAVAAVAPADVPAPSPLDRARTWVEGWRVQKAIAATAASMAGVVALSGVSIAASRSLPGDPFYGMKRTAEGVQVSLARNGLNRGKRHLQHAETRLHEIAKIVGTDIALAPAPSGPGQITVAFGGSRSTRVASALRAMDEETRDGTRLLFDAYTASHDDDALRVVRDFTERQRTHLDEVLDALPADAVDAAQQSLELVSDLNVRAAQLLAVGTCGDHCAAPRPAAPSPSDSASPEPVTSPSYDALGPVPCTCAGNPDATEEPAPEPTPSPQPTAEPTESPEPTGQPPSETATPAPESHYPLPSQVPSPVASVAQPVVDTVDHAAPTPLPTLPPLPSADAPLVPGEPQQ